MISVWTKTPGCGKIRPLLENQESWMSKRQEMREKRRRERVRNRVLIILLVVVGALLVTSALVWPAIQREFFATPVPVITITPRTFNAPVDGTSIGDPAAPVRLDVWEDFQCPACVNFSQSVMPQVIASYAETGKILYTFHFYPFLDDYSTAKESDQAANAAMCASEQGRFWDYHDMLFANWNGENEGAFVDVKLVRFADVLGLDMDQFNACFDESRYQADIDRDFAAEEAAGGHGTPFIMVDGVRVLSSAGEQYVPKFEDIAAAIEAALLK
jgi:protein-disulfide isomerase